MTTAEILLLDFDIEIANTRRTLERLPEDKADWAPHEKSMKLGRLAMHCATLPMFAIAIMQDPGMDMMASTRPRPSLLFESREKTLATLDEFAAQARAAIASTSDAEMLTLWPFTAGGTLILNDSRALCYRKMCMNHLIHHTAQLGVYLRLLELTVPALYGPSADEQWTAS